jgi:hypothetical protein
MEIARRDRHRAANDELDQSNRAERPDRVCDDACHLQAPL